MCIILWNEEKKKMEVTEKDCLNCILRIEGRAHTKCYEEWYKAHKGEEDRMEQLALF